MHVAIRLIPGRWPTLLLLMLLPGCGLNEYEARMTAIQKRIQRSDEENKLLDDYVLAPKRKEGDKSVAVATFSFRPPKGISSICAEGEPRGGLLYTYTARSAPPPAGSDSPEAIVRVELAFAPLKDKLGDDVMRIFRKDDDKIEWQSRQVEGENETLTVSSTEVRDDNYVYSINLYAGATTQTAVVFWILKGSEKQVQKVVDLSLSTLALDHDAAVRKSADKKSPWKLREGLR